MRRFLSALGLILLSACAGAPTRGVKSAVEPPPPPTTAELLERLRSPDAAARASAAWSLAGAGAVEADVVQALRAALDDPNAPVREAATWALWHVSSPDLDPHTLIDSVPSPLVQTKPKYPQWAFSSKVQGTVLLEILINDAGKVVRTEIRESLPGLDEAALACVREWKFEPARRQGKPVPSVAEAPVSFRIY